MRRVRLVTAALAVALFGSVFAAPSPAAAATITARSLLAAVPLAGEAGSTTYSRTYFNHWIDANGDCQNTRAEVLIAESKVAPTFTTSSRCTVATGRWFSYYDGVTWTLASDVDIDHMVALKEAWESGARSWTATDRERFANDLSYVYSLVAVTDNVNQSKSDRDPAEWLPPRASVQCTYAIQWIQVKYRWRLSINTAEKTALTNVLAGACGDRVVYVPPRAR